MLQKVKDYVTWGEIDEATLIKLISVRGRLVGDKPITDEYLQNATHYKSIEALVRGLLNDEIRYQKIKNVKPVFRLSPPTKGYKRIKRHYKVGGALGYRGDRINELLDRMI
jgi:large subunit ribosomal protein L30